MNILLVEDEARVADFIARGLRAERHSVAIARDGVAALEQGRDSSFDVIVLDLLLPKIHGHEVCQTLRHRGVVTPILMLTALGDVGDRISGLRLGADDYLAKPFSFDELLARLEALSRRGRAELPSQERRLELNGLVYDRETLEVTQGGERLKLTAKELAVLELLMSAPGKVFSRERILNNVWDVTEDPLTNIVDVYIGRLRKQLRSGGGTVTIETMRGFGYRMVATEAQPDEREG